MAKRRALPPRRLRMNREQRLQSARSFIRDFKGRNIARDYSQWFGVDRRCALIELTMLGVQLKREYVTAVYETARMQEQRAIAARPEREPQISSDHDGSLDNDWMRSNLARRDLVSEGSTD